MSLKQKLGQARRTLAERIPAPPGPITRRRLQDAKRLHLGCGDHILDGWANLDILWGRGIVTHNLTRRLPVDDGSVDVIYNEHFIEHITRDESFALLRECVRVLRPGGVLRVSTPNLRKLVDEYLEGDVDEWHDVDWQPATPCQMVNEAMRLWGHQFLYDEPELTAQLRAAGFASVIRVPWRVSEHSHLQGLECRPYHDEVILEATA